MAQARSEGNAKTRVVILFGGRSAEHEISLLSARNFVAARDRDRFTPFLIGIDKQGRWHLESQATLDAAVGDPRAVHLDAGAPLADASLLRPDDVVFPALHGTCGEDGTLQGLLELAGVAYVGAPVLGSAIGMDKDVAKRLLRDAGLPVVPYRLVTARGFRQEREACLRAGAVLGNDDPQASIPGEIVLSHRDGFYSYDAKYVDPTGAVFRVPAEIPEAVVARVRALSVATFRALELAGLARVDCFLDRGDGALYVNEVNTLPGFTAGSGYPKMWAASGLPVQALVSRLIDLAVERHRNTPARKSG